MDKEDLASLLAGPLGRARFIDQLADPRVRDRLFRYTYAEVGTQGPEAQQAFMETILNRALAQNKSVWDILRGSYFPPVTHSTAAQGIGPNTRASYEPILQNVMAGSNISNFATGNASIDPKTGKWVGFGGGPVTASYGGERYGIEKGTEDWWKNLGYGGSPAPWVPSGRGYAPPAPSNTTAGLGDLPPLAEASPAPSGLAALGRYRPLFSVDVPQIVPGVPPAWQFRPGGGIV